MFYSQYILGKKGPLSAIWLAAHQERKMKKTEVVQVNIPGTVDSVLYPEVPIALRLSGHLMLGIVRVYSRQVGYLFADCTDALVKIKKAFHSSAAVDLPPEAASATLQSITVVQNFDLEALDFLPDIAPSGAPQVDLHLTTAEHITLEDPLEEDYSFSSQLQPSDQFEAGGEVPNMTEEEEVLQKVGEGAADGGDGREEQQGGQPREELEVPPADMDTGPPDMPPGDMDVDVAGGSVPGGGAAVEEEGEEIVVEKLRSAAEVPQGGGLGGDLFSDLEMPPPLPQEAFPAAAATPEEGPMRMEEDAPPPSPATVGGEGGGGLDDLMAGSGGPEIGTPASLQAIDTPEIGVRTRRGQPKRRKVVIDEQMVITSERMKAQLSSTDDIVRRRRNAPPPLTPTQPLWSRGLEGPHALPSIPNLPQEIQALFQRLLPTHPTAVPAPPPPPCGGDGESEEFHPPPSATPGQPLGEEEEVSAAAGGARDGGKGGGGEEMVGEVERAAKRARGAVAGGTGEAVEVEVETLRSAAVLEGAAEEEEGDRPPGFGKEVQEEGEEGEGALPETVEMGMGEGEGEAEAFPPVGGGETPRFSLEGSGPAASDGFAGSPAVAYAGGLDFLGDSGAAGGEDGAEATQETDPGWSVRSRAVGKYLQSAFGGLESGEGGGVKLGLDAMVGGKTKKEAARMFFETLVLKTRDYIHVEQAEAYGDVLISAKPKLSKARF